MKNAQKKKTKKKQSLKNRLIDISFIGEEIQAFALNRAKQGSISKVDLTDLLRTINHRAWKLSKISKDIQKEFKIA